MSIKTAYSKFFVLAFAVVLVSAAFLVQVVQKSAAAGVISGTVYYDYNMNGVRNTTGAFPNYAVDAGVTGVTVTVYASNGATKTATTSATGTYSINTSAAPALPVGPYRVEFTTLPSGFSPTIAGSSDSTTTRFVNDGGSATVDLGVVSGTTYSENIPFLMTQVYNVGLGGSAHTIVRFPYNYADELDGRLNSVDPTSWTASPSRTSLLSPTGIALVDEVGATFGLTWNSRTKRAYASTFMKRGARLGDLSSESTGAIYMISDPNGATPTSSLYVDLNAVFGANTAGANTHPVASTPDWSADNATISEVGKRGLGGLRLSADGANLYTVNLADRRLYVIPTSGTLNSSTITRFDIPTTGLSTGGGNCAAADVRPFGVGRDASGQIYVGGVCSAESEAADTKLHAFVWRFNGSTFTLVANQTLTFTRDAATGESGNWQRWANTTGVIARPAPMLTDIEFDGTSMILGLRDRYGDQVVFPDFYRGYGDIMRVCLNAGNYVFETNGSCNGAGGAGTGTNEGPGGGEYYADLNGDGREEGGWGGLTQVPGYNHVVTTFYDPVAFNSAGTRVTNYYTGGVQRYSNSTGQLLGAYDVYLDADLNNFGKVNGGGDSEVLSNAAPLQIGNRVWNDTDSDGVQDPNETGIQNVVVQLWEDTDGNNTVDTQVGTATTTASGIYLFGGPNNDNMAATTCSAAGSLNLSVSGSSDDAEQNAGTNSVSITGNDLELTADGATQQIVGVRFNGVGIPQGSTITSATLEFAPRLGGGVTGAGNPTFSIRGENSDSAATFTTTSNDVGSRSLTTASVSWNPSATWLVGTPVQSPSITSVVQEVVNRAGWASGNSMAFVMSGAAANNYRRAESFDGVASSAPRLQIQYSNCKRSVVPNRRYEVRVVSSNFSSGQPLFGRTLSPTDSDGSANGDSRDSDGSLSGGGSAVSLLTGNIGQNNHTYDFGFYLAPTAANVSLEGRVATSDGRGIKNAYVFLTEENGTTHRAITGAFGYYRFDEVPAGQSVVVSVSSKRFVFKQDSQVIGLEDNATNIDFYGDPR
ncbi:MAG: carboxypeptidase regulatory-like domain-containing protein [Acidobacteria bacterium]|nr:carboxypeptidase regulatory-like domain-containing protein [Acidobacteriota bacterium]